MPAKKKKIKYEVVGDIELSDSEAADINQQIAQAEKELADARVHFRWGKQQVVMVKKVAAKMGVPYQTYIKQAVFRQAMQDLEQLDALEARIAK